MKKVLPALLVVVMSSFITMSAYASIDLATAYVSDSIDISGMEGEGLAWDGSYLWVTDTSAQKYSPISPLTKHIYDIYSISAFYDAEGLTWDGSYLWTFKRSNKTLYQIDSANGNIMYNILVGQGGSGGIAYDNGYIWKVNRPNFIKIDPSNGNIVDTISEFDISGIEEGLAYDGRYLYNIAYGSSNDPKIYKIDPLNHTLLPETFSLPKGTYNGLTYDGTNLWAVNYEYATIYKVSPEISPVPEPSSLLLLGFGLLGAKLWRKKKHIAS